MHWLTACVRRPHLFIWGQPSHSNPKKEKEEEEEETNSSNNNNNNNSNKALCAAFKL